MHNQPDNGNASIVTLRDHLANERTFLAWIRTSIGIMAFGFVVEKFSIFIKQIAGFFNQSLLKATHTLPFFQGYSKIFGIILVAVGALICLLAFIKFKKIENQINQNTYQPTSLLDAMLALIVIFIGVFLTLYLINSF